MPLFYGRIIALDLVSCIFPAFRPRLAGKPNVLLKLLAYVALLRFVAVCDYFGR